MYEATHPSLESDIYVAVKFLAVQVILVNYLLGNEVDCYFVIFLFLCWIFQMEVLNIYNEVFGIWGG